MRRIGFWKNEQHPELPDPSEAIDVDADPDLIHQVGFYFAKGTMLAVGFGFSTCRVCGEPNGSVEFTDGTYIWPEGLAHYVRDHSVRLPVEVEQHALDQLSTQEGLAANATDAWWRDQMGR